MIRRCDWDCFRPFEFSVCFGSCNSFSRRIWPIWRKIARVDLGDRLEKLSWGVNLEFVFKFIRLIVDLLLLLKDERHLSCPTRAHKTLRLTIIAKWLWIFFNFNLELSKSFYGWKRYKVDKLFTKRCLVPLCLLRFCSGHWRSWTIFGCCSNSAERWTWISSLIQVLDGVEKFWIHTDRIWFGPG